MAEYSCRQERVTVIQSIRVPAATHERPDAELEDRVVGHVCLELNLLRRDVLAAFRNAPRFGSARQRIGRDDGKFAEHQCAVRRRRDVPRIRERLGSEGRSVETLRVRDGILRVSRGAVTNGSSAKNEKQAHCDFPRIGDKQAQDCTAICMEAYGMVDILSIRGVRIKDFELPARCAGSPLISHPDIDGLVPLWSWQVVPTHDDQKDDDERQDGTGAGVKTLSDGPVMACKD